MAAKLREVLTGAVQNPLELSSSDLLEWGVRTGRVSPETRAAWQQALAAPEWEDQTRARQRLAKTKPLSLSTTSAAAPGRTVLHRSRLSNPVAAAIGRRHPQQVAAALATGVPEPTLFATGELPPFTVSGVDAQVLNDVPWQARPAVAEAATPSAAYELVQRYTGPGGEDLAAAECGVVAEDYEKRYYAWMAASATDAEVYDALFPEREQVGA